MKIAFDFGKSLTKQLVELYFRRALPIGMVIVFLIKNLLYDIVVPQAFSSHILPTGMDIIQIIWLSILITALMFDIIPEKINFWNIVCSITMLFISTATVYLLWVPATKGIFLLQEINFKTAFFILISLKFVTLYDKIISAFIKSITNTFKNKKLKNQNEQSS